MISVKKTIWLVLCIFLTLLIGGSILLFQKNSPKCGLLKINGVDITRENVMIHSNYAELPLTKVMKSLDMNVNWVDKSTAEITYKDKKYTLNLSMVSFTEVGQTTNLLLPPPGGNRSYTVLEEELILDSNTIKSVMYQLGRKIDIDINSKEKIICIFERVG